MAQGEDGASIMEGTFYDGGVLEFELGPKEWVLLAPPGSLLPSPDLLRAALEELAVQADPAGPLVECCAVAKYPGMLGPALLHYRAGRTTVYCRRGSPHVSGPAEPYITPEGAAALSKVASGIAGRWAGKTVAANVTVSIETTERDRLPAPLRPVCASVDDRARAVAVVADDDELSAPLAAVLARVAAAQISRMASRARPATAP